MKKRSLDIKVRVYCLLVFMCSMFAAQSQNLQLQYLRCDYRENPLGIESPQPRLSWEIISSMPNTLQTGYHILVADDSINLAKGIGNVWDSEKQPGNASINLPYNGKPLSAAKKYWWKLMIWDNHGNRSDWSNIAFWQMGLQVEKDWSHASWIGYEDMADSSVIAPHMHQGGKKAWGARLNVLPVMRKQFAINKKVKSATAFVAGLGHFTMTVNGRPASDDFLAPGWTNYEKQALYVTYDITTALQNGNNAIGVMLGNGFYYIPSQRYRKMTGAYGYPKLKMKIVIAFSDGTQQIIVTDKSWKTAPSPITFSSIFGGEDYDATLLQPRWNLADFDDSHWKQVVTVEGPTQLQSQVSEPVKSMRTLSSINSFALRNNVSVYDFGQNASGIPAIAVQGHKGDTIRLYPAELLKQDGSANQKATGSPSYFTYIIGSDSVEYWQPSFMYTGFRFVEAHCIAADSKSGLPEVLNMELKHVHNAAPEAGSFHCNNVLFNKTYQLIDWAIRSNMVSLFTDCPHREKLGWLEQTHLMGASIHYRYDVASLNRKVFDDISLAQYADGKIPEIAPEYTVFTPPFDESPEWGSAAIIYPWYHFRWYGDTVSLRRHYSTMVKYVGYLSGRLNSEGILTHGLGDWFDIGPGRPGFSQMTTMGITATATFYYDLHIMQQVAMLLGKHADASAFARQAASVQKAFNKRFFDPVNGRYDTVSQTANAMALYMGLVAEENRDKVLSALVNDLRSRNNALTAGDVGYRYVLQALQRAGRNDVIFDMNDRDDVAGYGYQLKQGATALTESWQALPSVSNNHLMLGHLMEWFYEGLLGISQSSASVAYQQFEIAPAPVGNITQAAGSFRSPYGVIDVSWNKTDSSFQLYASIPPNSSATCILPESIRGKIIVNNTLQAYETGRDGRRTFVLGSGKYAVVAE